MLDKSFEHSITFTQVPGTNVWLPLVTVYLIQPSGNRVQLSLLFDTGASVTTLRDDMYTLLGVPSWDSGIHQQSATAAGIAPTYAYRARLEFLGKAVDCQVNLTRLPPNPLFVGLLGREQVFDEFGFGFWERNRELYVTTSP